MLRRRKITWREQGEPRVTTRAEIGMACQQAKNGTDCQHHHKLEEARMGPPLEPQRESVARPTPWFWTSSFQNWERRHLCCFNPPYSQFAALWTAAPDNKYISQSALASPTSKNTSFLLGVHGHSPPHAALPKQHTFCMHLVNCRCFSSFLFNFYYGQIF